MTAIEELKKKLLEGVVEFSYTKKDGSLRTAKGTLCMDNIPEDQHPNGNGIVVPGVLRYYDLNSEGWRSFKEDNLVEG